MRKGLYALSGAVAGSLSVHEFEIAMALVRPAAIEGIHLPKEELEILRKQGASAFKHVYAKSSGSRK